MLNYLERLGRPINVWLDGLNDVVRLLVMLAIAVVLMRGFEWSLDNRSFGISLAALAIICLFILSRARYLKVL
jgi:hypothetical protein